MATLKFHTLDVFTDRRFAGNPLAVVLDADGLADAQMQAIAREFNLSETVFVQASERPAHSAKMRIFTPHSEVPFAGHPTIGTAALLAELKAPLHNGEQDALIVLEQAIGTVRVGVRARAGAAAFAEFDAPKLPAEAGVLPPTDILAAGLGLIPSEIGFENHKPLCFAAGNTFAFVPVATLDAIRRARVNGSHWESAFEQQGVVGAYLYTRQCEHNGHAFHARMFAPQMGIPEDAATGSAAVGLTGAVHLFDRLPDGTHKRIVEQGYEMGRPSQIALTIVMTGGKLTTVRIGGDAVRVTEGTITI
ncbi:MAG: PhzF family phenazine biosynthesis protein [Hyphomicrobium sp.]|jgi:trans-2,3-dihydro-3-hydroxyanthranilate isomerase|uniref:PhzF family phenazine biosynthesis protein n=1 Tax=Hyphomicrobium sp. TaxID=82 RepID=UPI0025C5EC43|nr:PhzF family phenazine biosynthesis protein [Hyphomicrobium sp.]MBX9861774.1 PhzF family phenazine biosynthesis protein [Hyphomicrobium sp.]